MVQILNQQWLDQNADRSYPLVDNVSRTDTSGAFQIPNDLIVDMRLSAPANYDPTAFYLSSFRAFGTGLIITIAVTGHGDVATVTIPRSESADYTPYTAVALPGFTVGGTVIIGGSLSAVAASEGLYSFTAATTLILPTVIFPAAESVSSITFRDSFGVETKLVGDILIAAGDNATVGVASQTITVGMDTGVLIEDPCPCTDTGGRKRTSVKSINGVTPDISGNIDLVPVGCVQIETDNGQLKLKDNCASPCCGTPELSLLADAAKNIQQYLVNLATKNSELEAVIRLLHNYLAQ